MELTLNIPDRLVFRLRPHEARLAKILELGLDALEAAEGFTTLPPKEGLVVSEVGDPELSLWQTASDALDSSWRDAVSPEPLSRDLLAAYGRGELDDDAAEAVRAQLMLQPQALEDLLIMPDDLQDSEPQGVAAEISDADVRQAWRQLQLRQASRAEATGDDSAGADAATADQTRADQTRADQAKPEASTHREVTAEASVITMPRRRSQETAARPLRWLAVAAALLLTTGGVVSTQRYIEHQAQAPKLSSSIHLGISRGPRPFEVDAQAQNVLLLIDMDSTLAAEGRPLLLSIRDRRDGRIVYRQKLATGNGVGSTLHLLVPREQLPNGTYDLTMSETDRPNETVGPSYPFTLEASREVAP